MSDFQTYLAKAEELKENKDFERAIEQYLKALDFKPADYETLEKIADAYFCLSNFEKAIAFYQKSLAFEPNYILSLLGISKAYELIHKIDKAIEYLEKVLELSSYDSDIAAQLALLYIENQEYTISHKLIEKLLSQN